MKKELVKLLFLLALAVIVLAGAFYWDNLRGVVPAIKPPPDDIGDVIDSGDAPLGLPAGFSVSVFVRDLPGARAMVLDSLGNMWVSQTREGIISLVGVGEDGVVRSNPVFRNLNRPHGIALSPDDPFLLYVAEEDKISRVRLYSEGQMEKIVDLPQGDRHFTRTLGFGAGGRLYVSIGSSCDVCEEDDARFAAIYSMNPDGTDFREFARGLRNAVFFTFDESGQMWATEMGRDNLGDDLPPDEINIVREGEDYGWPICYGKNIHDTDFDKKTYVRAPCEEPFTQSSFIDIPAHSAPLGLAFYEGDLLVAYHGSWNRTVPTGYKVVRMVLDDDGNYIETKDFITGWLTDSGALGRPVDIKVGLEGEIYISDDHAGVIYKVTN